MGQDKMGQGYMEMIFFVNKSTLLHNIYGENV